MAPLHNEINSRPKNIIQRTHPGRTAKALVGFHPMARTLDNVESYLLQLNRQYEGDKGTLLISGRQDVPPIALRVEAPIVAVRVAVGPIPSDPQVQLKLFRRVLEYNATDLMHVSYGIEHGTLILSAALELENLDLNELDAVLSDIDLALARHISVLRGMSKAS